MAVWISAMRFDFVDLRLLVHVAETGNLTAGAARLPIALSAASQRIRKLETLFGVSLFERERDGDAADRRWRALRRACPAVAARGRPHAARS